MTFATDAKGGKSMSKKIPLNDDILPFPGGQVLVSWYTGWMLCFRAAWCNFFYGAWSIPV